MGGNTSELKFRIWDQGVSSVALKIALSWLIEILCLFLVLFGAPPQLPGWRMGTDTSASPEDIQKMKNLYYLQLESRHFLTGRDQAPI